MARVYSEQEIVEIKREAADAVKIHAYEAGAQNPALPETHNFEFCKKPEKFDAGRGNIRKYIQRWDAYRRVVNIKDENATRIFLTFLDDTALNKLLDNMSTAQKDDWAAAKPIIIELLEPTFLPFEAKIKLGRAKQKHDESIEAFVSRLLDLGNKAYKNEEQTVRDRLVLDRFLSGLRSKQMTMFIFSKYGQNMSLDQAKTEAKNLEIAIMSRAAVRSAEYDENEQEGQVCAFGEGPSGSSRRGHSFNNNLSENEGHVWENEVEYDHSYNHTYES